MYIKSLLKIQIFLQNTNVWIRKHNLINLQPGNWEIREYIKAKIWVGDKNCFLNDKEENKMKSESNITEKIDIKLRKMIDLI